MRRELVAQAIEKTVELRVPYAEQTGRRRKLNGCEVNAAEQAVASAAASEQLCPCGSPTPSPAAPNRSPP